jgi:beta-lactamase class A
MKVGLLKSIEEVIPEDIEIGLSILDSEGKYYGISDNELFPLASLSKLLASIVALSMNKGVDTKLISKSISEHCNDSYQTILDLCGIDAINSHFEGLGLSIIIDRDNTSEYNNVGTPKSLSCLMSSVLEYKLLNEDNVRVLSNSLQNQTDPDGFKFNRFCNTDWAWAHMTGGLESICNDMGYFKSSGGYVICIGLVRAIHKTQWVKLEETLNVIGEIIKEHLNIR